MSAENKKTLQYINEYYNNQEETKIAPKEIFKMIEQMMTATNVAFGEEAKIIDAEIPEILLEKKMSKSKMAKFMTTALAAYQVPSEQAGKLDTAEREKFEKHVTNHIGGNTLEEKIKVINQFAKGETVDPNASIATILSHCGLLSILSRMVEDFNPSAAGFAFEAFLAALLQGIQIADPEGGGQLPIEDAIFYMDKDGGGTPTSLKLLNAETEIEGSLTNLLKFLETVEEGMWHKKGKYPYIEYMVAIKHDEKVLGFNSFIITPHNFFDWIPESVFDWKKVSLPETKNTKKLQEEESESDSYEKKAEDYSKEEIADLQKKVDVWKGLMADNYFPYIGFEASTKTGQDSLSVNSFIPIPANFSTTSNVRNMVATAMSSENTFKGDQPPWNSTGEPLDAIAFNSEDINMFKNLESLGEEEGRLFLMSMRAKLTNRRASLFKYVENSIGQDHNLNPFAIKRLGKIMKDLKGDKKQKKALRKGSKARNAQELLQNLLSEKEYRLWAAALAKGLPGKIKFKIPNKSIRSGERLDTKHYGTLIIDSKAVEDLIQRYADKLLELCAPIYGALGELTDNINNFFLGTNTRTKSSAAINAAKNANELGVHAEKLQKEGKEN